MNIVPLFPTPIGKVPDFISEKDRLFLVKKIKSIKHLSHSALRGDASSTHTNSSDFLERSIKKKIQSAVDEFASVYGTPPLRISQVWSNIQKPGSILKEHRHPHSVLSGALYVNVDKESSKIYFHNPNSFVTYEDFVEYNHYNFQWMSFQPENCLLVLFPSWLWHGSEDVNKSDDRIVISFNTSLRDSHEFNKM